MYITERACHAVSKNMYANISVDIQDPLSLDVHAINYLLPRSNGKYTCS